MANTKVDIQMDPMRRTDFSGYKPFRDGDRVVVTLPDGTQEGFTFYAQPNQTLFSLVIDYIPTFIPDFGVKSELIVDQMTLVKDNSTGQDYHDGSGDLYTPLHPRYGGAFLLRMRNGNELAINARTGELASITDRNGNTLNFTGMGIESSAGRGVQFERDWAGRITSLIDPAGNSIQYAYSAAGDLVSVIDRVGAETQFTYRTDVPHYLDTIIDPLGRPAAKTEYDEDGRIIALVDAQGNRIETSYDVTGKTQSITDPLGNTSTQTLDGRGNIVREVDPTGVIIRRTFDAEDRLLSETQVIGEDDTLGNEDDDLTTVYVYL